MGAARGVGWFGVFGFFVLVLAGFICENFDLMKVLWHRKVCASKKVPLLYCYYRILSKDDESFSVILPGDTDGFDSVTVCGGLFCFLKNDVKCFCRSSNSL